MSPSMPWRSGARHSAAAAAQAEGGVPPREIAGSANGAVTGTVGEYGVARAVPGSAVSDPPIVVFLFILGDGGGRGCSRRSVEVCSSGTGIAVSGLSQRVAVEAVGAGGASSSSSRSSSRSIVVSGDGICGDFSSVIGTVVVVVAVSLNPGGHSEEVLKRRIIKLPGRTQGVAFGSTWKGPSGSSLPWSVVTGVVVAAVAAAAAAVASKSSARRDAEEGDSTRGSAPIEGASSVTVAVIAEE